MLERIALRSGLYLCAVRSMRWARGMSPTLIFLLAALQVISLNLSSDMTESWLAEAMLSCSAARKGSAQSCFASKAAIVGLGHLSILKFGSFRGRAVKSFPRDDRALCCRMVVDRMRRIK